MCDLWKNTLNDPIPSGVLVRQLDHALSRLPQAEIIKLYNNGNFFDRKAIPPSDYPGIIERLLPYKRVILENHPRLCGRACVEFSHQIPGTLELALGLESIHPEVYPRLNKKLSPEIFRRAGAYLRSQDIELRAFILLNPPFLTDPGENLLWTLKTLQFAFDCGSSCCSIIPTRPGNGIMELLREQGHYIAPSLDALEEVFDRALELKQGRVFVDTWDLAFLSRCPDCFEARKLRLERMNILQEVLARIPCSYLNHHEGKPT